MDVALIAGAALLGFLLLRPGGRGLSGMSAKDSIQALWDLRLELRSANDPWELRECIQKQKAAQKDNSLIHFIEGGLGTIVGGLLGGPAGASAGNKVGNAVASIAESEVPSCKVELQKAKDRVSAVRNKMAKLGIDPDTDDAGLVFLMTQFGYPQVYDPQKKIDRWNELRKQAEREEDKKVAEQHKKDLEKAKKTGQPPSWLFGGY